MTSTALRVLLGTLLLLMLLVTVGSARAGAEAASGETARTATEDALLQPYVDALATHGADPLDFVLEKLDEYDLLIFDDALHTSVEPFEFYQKLVLAAAFTDRVTHIFLELIPINRQPSLDAYLDSAEENRELLYPAFQDATSFGLPYKTYFDLLHAIYVTNHALPEDERIRVVAVSNPAYWDEIRTAQDVELYRKSMLGRDNSMYRIIHSEMAQFEADRKGIFLTNTRHAYTGIRGQDDQFHWNTATFFAQWHPGHTYSLRFHSVALFIEKRRELVAAEERTTQGLEEKVFSWVRMGDGIWDSAFRALGNEPIAVPLRDTPFGREAYIGNHMLNVAPGQTMSDAYDALIFLAPLEELRQTAMLGEIFTTLFATELARRYRMHFSEEQIAARLERSEVTSLEELIRESHRGQPESLLPQASQLGPIDGWRR